MSRESFDIVDQIGASSFEPPSNSDMSPGSRSNNTRDEDQQVHQSPLGVELTGYRLLSVALILAFGIPKAILSYHGQSVMPTTLELVSGTLLAVILLYFGWFQDKHSEIWPLFFQVDWAPPILKFVRRSEVYCLLLSLSSIRPAVTLLDEFLGFSIGPGDYIEIVTWDGDHEWTSQLKRPTFWSNVGPIVAILWICLDTLAALQYFTKVVYRLRALHNFMDQDMVSMSLLVALVAVQPFTKFLASLKISEVDSVYGPGIVTYQSQNSVSILVITMAPIVLLLESVDFQKASAFLRQMEGQTVFQQLMKKLDVVLQITKRIPWALLYLVAISMALFQDHRFPFDFTYEIPHLWCLWVFFSYRVLSTLPTFWHSFMPDTVRSAV